MRFVTIALCVIALQSFASCSFDEESTNEYDESAIIQRREDIDEMFRNSDQSPIKSEDKDAFKGLQYFAPSEEYAILASFDAYENPDTVQLATSKAGEKRAMLKYGTFSFQSPDGSSCTLTAYKYLDIDVETLFIPFKDKSNGFTTYETGRYLEVDESASSEEYLLDFNKAYNPYCAYNAEYSCPLIPAENILKTTIAAGEKKPAEK